MNHPPKKKHRDPLLPDENSVDERNLIDLKDSANLSLEDRVNLYWKENQRFLIACIAVLLLVVIGYQVMRMIKEQAEATLQAEYVEADANSALAEFARANKEKALGGFAALETADEAYTAEDYEKAAEFYELAASALQQPMLTGRARIGLAFATYYAGRTEEGLAQLNAVASDNTLAEAIRTEAAYHLAVEAHSAGRADEFSGYSAQVKNSKFAGQWQQRLQSLPVIQVADSKM